jgi:hypothetical protein
MPSTIGVRIYRFDFRERGSRSLLPFDSSSLAKHPRAFIDDFANKNSTHNQDSEVERSWYFEKRHSNSVNNLRGYVRYGTFGFESNLVDSQTKTRKYQRKITDVEEIPLFFDFWTPNNSRFGLVAFQSFQGRSCINLVMKKMKDDFERESPGCIMVFKKLMPSDLRGSIFYTAPIKRMRLIRRRVSVDPADIYLNEGTGDSIDMELTLSARRSKNLGNLVSLKTKMPANKDGVIEYEGLEFNEAVAEIKLGGTLRKVGVFGYNSDAGVIDLTDSVVKGADGHPTFESLQRETTTLLTDFYRVVNGS